MHKNLGLEKLNNFPVYFGYFHDFHSTNPRQMPVDILAFFLQCHLYELNVLVGELHLLHQGGFKASCYGIE
jgi:hypothetical protein